MIPILYEKNEKEFTSGGIGYLPECTSCVITQERNGIYECEFIYPNTGKMYPEIKEGRIILASHDETKVPQPFDIYARSAPINGLVTFYAHHISYRLSNAVVMPFSATSCDDAIDKIAEKTITTDEFTFWTDKETSGDYAIVQPSIVREVLGGSDGSLLDRYGRGDYEFDKFSVKLYQNKGVDTDVEIRYGKNMIEIEHKTSTEDAYNAIVPYWVDESTGELVTLPEGYVYHDDGSPYLVAVPYAMNEFFESKPTIAQVRAKAQALLDSSESWEPNIEITVNFTRLRDVDENARFAPLQNVNLCDTLSIFYPELGVVGIRQRVVKTVYDTLLDRYQEITLNSLATNLSDLTSEQISTETATNATVAGVNASINLAVSLIRGGLGGYILIPVNSQGYNEAIYILDQASAETATNVIRLGSDGISRSSTGINGTYIPIIDMSGGITGNLTGNVTGNLTGNVIVMLSGATLSQLLAMALSGENVTAIKSTNPFVLIDGSGSLGYRYGGSAGSGAYGAPHYFKGNLIVDGDITVTGKINNGGA